MYSGGSRSRVYKTINPRSPTPGALFLGAVAKKEHYSQPARARLFPPMLFLRPVASAALSLLLLSSQPSIEPACAKELSPEQYLAAEAWTKTDKSFVDRSFSGQDWFKRRQTMIKKSYGDREETYDEIRSMLDSLGDRYTRFLTPAMYSAVYSVATGDVAGIGCEIAAADGKITTNQKVAPDAAVVFSTIIEGSPAEAAGLRPGDVLEEVDGFGLRGLSPEEAAAKVRGPKGSRLRLTVSRAGEPEPLVKLITRAEVKLAGVTSSLQNKVGFIRIKQFSTTTADDVKAALGALRDKGATAFVVDLRGNTGGYFPGGVDVAKLFLKAEQPITYVVDKRDLTTTCVDDR